MDRNCLDARLNRQKTQVHLVLHLYFAQARMYDPINKRFMAADPIKGEIIDPQGNVTYDSRVDVYDYYNIVIPENEYMYDRLNRLIAVDAEIYTRIGLDGFTSESHTSEYKYDSLGNLTRATENGVVTTYGYNNLNQQINKSVGSTVYTNTFDKRGNLTKTASGANTIATYIYDTTNRMVKGTNEQGQISEYKFNGLGYLAETKRNGLQKSYVLDYTSELKNVIMETESGTNGLTYRHVYGLEKVSVTVGGEKFYYHYDQIGSLRVLSDTEGTERSVTVYDPWGDFRYSQAFTVNGRSLDLVKSYTSHSYDDVLNLYFAQARMYDPVNKRFMAADPIKGEIIDPQSLVQYTYVLNNPLVYIDPDGLKPYSVGIGKSYLGFYVTYGLEVTPLLFDMTMDAIPLLAGRANPLTGAIIGAVQKPYLWMKGYSEISYNMKGRLNDAAGITGGVMEGLSKSKSVEVVGKVLGTVSTGYEINGYRENWFSKHKYQVEEAIYNHFSRDIWESFSRKQVGAKFKYAMREIESLIREGKMEVKKAKDVFGKDAFRNHLNAAYEKDPLIGGKKYFSPNDYYFFPLDGSSAGALKEIQEAIKKMGR